MGWVAPRKFVSASEERVAPDTKDLSWIPAVGATVSVLPRTGVSRRVGLVPVSATLAVPSEFVPATVAPAAGAKACKVEPFTVYAPVIELAPPPVTVLKRRVTD